MDVLPLPPDEVHVWCADPAELRAAPAEARALEVLADDERERASRFRFAADRTLYVATRVLVRGVLSRYAPVAPAAWRFAREPHGRPYVADGAGAWLRFNASNTAGLVACAVARGAEVGVDVEHLGTPAPLELADRHFAPAEAAALRALPPAERGRRFYEYWTLKESYAKARGLGLTIPLDHVRFTLEAGRAPRLDAHPALGDAGRAWQFALREPTAAHVLSLCVRRGAADARVALRWTPLAPSAGHAARP